MARWEPSSEEAGSTLEPGHTTTQYLRDIYGISKPSIWSQKRISGPLEIKKLIFSFCVALNDQGGKGTLLLFAFAFLCFLVAHTHTHNLLAHTHTQSLSTHTHTRLFPYPIFLCGFYKHVLHNGCCAVSVRKGVGRLKHQHPCGYLACCVSTCFGAEPTGQSSF